jgi:YHS domain-containing protein
MTGWILKLVLLIVIIRAILRLVRGIAHGLRGASGPPRAVALVRDPICGTFVAPSTAPSVGSGAQMQFFCSEECRRTYQAKFAQ